MKALVYVLMLSSSAAFANNESFLNETESRLVAHVARPAGLVILREQFIEYAESPATEMWSQEVEGHAIDVVVRDGQTAILVDEYVFQMLTLRRIDEHDKMESWCSSSCWDDALGGAMKDWQAGAAGGFTAGAGVGAGIGWYVGGPAGAAFGGAVGGAGGAVAGGASAGAGGAILEYNKCEQAKAEKCAN